MYYMEMEITDRENFKPDKYETIISVCSVVR